MTFLPLLDFMTPFLFLRNTVRIPSIKGGQGPMKTLSDLSGAQQRARHNIQSQVCVCVIGKELGKWLSYSQNYDQ